MKTPQEKYKPNILYTCRCKKPSVKCQQMKSHGITKTLRTRTPWETPREHKPCNREQASDQIQPSTLKPLGKPGGVGDSPTQQRAGKADPQRTPDRERPRLSLGVRSEAGPLVSPQRLLADRSSGKSREKGARRNENQNPSEAPPRSLWIGCSFKGGRQQVLEGRRRSGAPAPLVGTDAGQLPGGQPGSSRRGRTQSPQSPEAPTLGGAPKPPPAGNAAGCPPGGQVPRRLHTLECHRPALRRRVTPAQAPMEREPGGTVLSE